MRCVMKGDLKMKNREINSVLNLYNVNPNYYHTYCHYLDCMNKFERKIDLLNFEMTKLLQYPFDLRWSIDFFNDVFLWHDSVYIPGNSNNEELSAKEYKRFVTKVKGERFVNFDVYEAILSTKIGYDIDERLTSKKFKMFCKIIHDIDWLGFANYEECVKNERKIINEALAFTNLTTREVKEKRLEFYESIVDKDLYLTETFGCYNEIARENIQKRIKKLKENLKCF